MKILITSSTAVELGPLCKGTHPMGKVQDCKISSKHSVSTLITGIGVASTTLYLTQVANMFDFIINIGICGSYKNVYAIGNVFCVSHDIFADYGIDDNGTFLSPYKTQLNTDPQYFKNSWAADHRFKSELEAVKGITVSMTSGSQQAIDKNLTFWNPDIETMESAAIFFVCNALNIPFMCFRAISNMVEPRNKSHWRTEAAIEQLHVELSKYINSL